jgi:hypothetical protein
MATTLHATLMVSDDLLNLAQVSVHQHPSGSLITAVRLGEFTLQAYRLDPEPLAEILESLAGRVREQYALWLTQPEQGSGTDA